MLRSGHFRTVFASTMFFSLLAPDALRSLLSWWGYGAVVSALALVSIAVLVVERDRWAVRQLPIPLVAFLVLAAASIGWSHYPSMSALGAATTWATVTGAVALAVAIPWSDLLRTLGYALRAILALSLAFELFLAIFIQQPVLPLWYSPVVASDEIPSFDYWSMAHLFDGGKIQGIVGNSNLLGLIALLGVIVFGVQLADKRVRLLAGWTSMVGAVLTLGLTRSATITVAIVALVVVVGAVWLLRRAKTRRARRGAYATIALVIVAIVSTIAVFHAEVLALLGKEADITGRVYIWEAVSGLAQQRPLFGWGWISHWAPWVDPLGTLAMVDGVFQLQAHNAWLDVWMQLGVVGLLILGALALVTIVRSWWFAVDRRKLQATSEEPFIALTLFPLLTLTALMVQSLSESRLLVEGGLLLFALIAVKTKRHELG